MSSETISSTRELREELVDVAKRARDASFIRDSRDEPTHSVPNDDEPWSVADVAAEIMAGMYAHGARVDIFGYRLYNASVTEELPNVWTVHPPSGGRALDAVNLGRFRSAAEFETYITDLAERRNHRGDDDGH